MLLFHAELDSAPHAEKPQLPAGHESVNTLYTTFLHSRPQTLETDAISLITKLQRAFPALRCHIVHLSASSALPIIQDARKSGLKLSVETCFHYLCLSSEHIPPGRPQFKCCPPVREAANRDLLWEALKKGIIDFVVSDHSPCVASLKRLDDGDIMEAWGGISSLGLGLSLIWTEGRKRGITIRQIVDWLCTNTAKHAGLGRVKGQLKTGYDADVVIWNPDMEWKVRDIYLFLPRDYYLDK
jgi:allantoinase